MTLTTKLKSPKRTIITAAIVVALAGGTAYALLQVWGIILGNTISTANAGLVVSTDNFHYGPAIPGGLNFSKLIPGGYPAPAGGNSLYLKNNGGTDLDLSFTLSDPPYDTDPDDMNNISIILTDVSGNTPAKSFTLSSLLNSNEQPLGIDLPAGASREFKIQAQASDDAQPDTTIGNVNLAFVGTARDPNSPN